MQSIGNDIGNVPTVHAVPDCGRYLVRAVLAVLFTQVAHQRVVTALLGARELGDVRRVYRAPGLLARLLRQRHASVLAQCLGRVCGCVASFAQMCGTDRAIQNGCVRLVLVAQLIRLQPLAFQHQGLLTVGLLEPLEQLDERKVLLQIVHAVLTNAGGLSVEGTQEVLLVRHASLQSQQAGVTHRVSTVQQARHLHSIHRENLLANTTFQHLSTFVCTLKVTCFIESHI